MQVRCECECVGINECRVQSENAVYPEILYSESIGIKKNGVRHAIALLYYRARQESDAAFCPARRKICRGWQGRKFSVLWALVLISIDGSCSR